MGQSDLDSRTIDLHLYGNFPVEILYQYEYVVQLEKLNYGQLQQVLEMVLHIDARFLWNKNKVFTEMTSRHVLH